MAKRANPFTDEFVQQYKVHVGIKQFNNNEDRLKKVYEKTLQLLFNGAKKCSIQDTANYVDPVSHDDKKDGMKQLFIGKDGTLVHSGKVVPDRKSSAQDCPCGTFSRDAQCAYCDAALCSSCQHYCLLCSNTYCSHCSLVGCEGAEVCVSCCGRPISAS